MGLSVLYCLYTVLVSVQYCPHKVSCKVFTSLHLCWRNSIELALDILLTCIINFT